MLRLALGAPLVLLVVERSAAADLPPVRDLATVWAVDDGEKIKQDEIDSASMRGEGNPIWKPGGAVRLMAAKNETVAFQVVVTARHAALDDVTVELPALVKDDGTTIANAAGATDPTRYVGRPIERFVEHFLDVPRASGGKVDGESLGWARGSGPKNGRFTGKIPDALVPVDAARSSGRWSPYPMHVAPRTNGIVWIDVTIGKDQAAGLYKGRVSVKRGSVDLSSLSVEVDVADVTLADRPVKAMLVYAKSELDGRIGAGPDGDEAERHLWRLFHRHRVSPMHGAKTTTELAHVMPALDGSFYTKENGYEGPGEAMGDGVLSLGTYGSFGEPDETKRAAVEAIAERIEEKGLFSKSDVFVYANDEDCKSPWGAKWKALLEKSASPSAKKVRVAWTCSEDASSQPVDIPIQAAAFDPKQTERARANGKEVWAYNGQMPFTGTWLTDSAAIGPRVNAWLLGTRDIGRWFYWETTFWNDDNKGGKGPYDPFATAETFHNKDGDWCMGDGVLVYPGKQVDRFVEHSLGMAGVVASIRLKNFRRGIQDVAYYQLARAVNADAADRIVAKLIPRAFGAAKAGERVSWSEDAAPWAEARRSLRAMIEPGTIGAGPPPRADVKPPPQTTTGCTSGCRGCSTSAFGVTVVLLLRRRRRQDGKST